MSVLQQKERHQDEIRIRTPTSPRLTTIIIRRIRSIVDPDDLILYVTVRIRNTLLVLDAPLHFTTRTTQQKVSDFSHSCAFFCYLLAFHSSVPPSFFDKTTKRSSALSTSTSSNKHQQNASQGNCKSSFTLFHVHPLPSSTHSPKHAARVEAKSRIGHSKISSLRHELDCPLCLPTLPIQYLKQCELAYRIPTRARVSGTQPPTTPSP